MDLTIPSFLMAVVGLVLQFVDAFPEHREVRKTIVTMGIGFFAGALANGFSGARYEITGNLDAKYALLFVLIGLILVFALLGTLLTDEKKRENAGAAAWVATGLFVVTGFAVALSGVERAPDLSTDELIVLAQNAEARGEFERAIDYQNQLSERLPSSSSRDEIKKRIDRLEKLQLTPQRK